MSPQGEAVVGDEGGEGEGGGGEQGQGGWEWEGAEQETNNGRGEGEVFFWSLNNKIVQVKEIYSGGRGFSKNPLTTLKWNPLNVFWMVFSERTTLETIVSSKGMRLFL